MIDISYKTNSLREAKASAIIQTNKQTIQLILENKIPKGNAFEISKSVGLLAIKKTPFLLPFCHNIPIHHGDITFEIKENEIVIEAKVVSISQTGVEMEALTAVTTTALNVYDMLKAIDKNIIIISTSSF